MIAVDGSAVDDREGARVARRRRDEAIVADLLELELEEPVDVVFSSAVFHWILDHDALFARLRAALRPGGRLAAQCGGAGNIAELAAEQRRGRRAREPYAPHFEGFGEPWNYAAPGGDRGAAARGPASPRRAAGCSLGRSSRPSPPSSCAPSASARTLDRLPEELREPFVDASSRVDDAAAGARLRAPQHRGRVAAAA